MTTDSLLGNVLFLLTETTTAAQKIMKTTPPETGKWILSLMMITSIMASFSTPAAAQLQITAESGIIGGSGDQTPFWLHMNRHGIHSGEGNQLYANTRLHYTQSLSDTFTWGAGGVLHGRAGSEPVLFLTQGYLSLHGYGFSLKAGAFYNTSPFQNDRVGLGSLGVSTNANPVPQIRLEMDDWLPLPFTAEFLQIKAHVAHGWLGSNRHVDNVLLHEKAGHLRIGGRLPVNVYGGIAHYAHWGGMSPEFGDIPTRFTDFKSVFLATAGDDDTPGQDQEYILGNHVGTINFGSFIDLSAAEIHIYRQFPIETKDNLKLKSIQDALTGISVIPAGDSPVRSVVYEFLYTKYQDGPRRPNILSDGLVCLDNPNVCRDNYRGNQNYYNHNIYKSGWTYNVRTMGNPLFLVNSDNLGIINNRIVAHHAGIEAEVGEMVVSGKVTYSRNYGRRCDNRFPDDIGEGEIFGIECTDVVYTSGGQRLDQWSFLAAAEFPVFRSRVQNIHMKAELALDNGNPFGSQAGVLLGLIWRNR